MIVTEQEAKGKWCPMARDILRVDNTHYTERITRQKCIASACMLWVWNITPAYVEKYKKDNQEAILDPTGHCGFTEEIER